MKLLDIILLVLGFCFFVIGIHQAIVVGIAESYWIFMFSLMPLFLYGYRKNKFQEQEAVRKKKADSPKKKKRKNG
ncbi:MAG: hypothetical protein Tsb0034_07310 [Ekhidna sp.]